VWSQHIASIVRAQQELMNTQVGFHNETFQILQAIANDVFAVPKNNSEMLYLKGIDLYLQYHNFN
jgi:hypothetical protein